MITVEWAQVDCGRIKLDLWTARVVSPVRTVEFVKVGRRLDGGWNLWFCPKGTSVHQPYSIHTYGFNRAKPMAHAERWARAHWRTIPLA
jgi:hypothetical protein